VGTATKSAGATASKKAKPHKSVAPLPSGGDQSIPPIGTTVMIVQKSAVGYVLAEASHMVVYTYSKDKKGGKSKLSLVPGSTKTRSSGVAWGMLAIPLTSTAPSPRSWACSDSATDRSEHFMASLYTFGAGKKSWFGASWCPGFVVC